MRTRFAPTPSGYLHLGNAVHMVVIRRLAELWSSQIALRIDDFDAQRARREYVQDIFDACAWLDLSWQLGPRSRDEYELIDREARNKSMKASLVAAIGNGMPAYACACSRQSRSGGHTCTCAERDVPWAPGSNALRVRVPDTTVIQVGTRTVDLASHMGDFVIWRKDDVPAYQLASVLSDRALDVDLLIRGDDLLESSAAQLYLCEWLGYPQLRAARMVHHRLTFDVEGRKLSKSAGAQSAPLERSTALRDHIEWLADEELLHILDSATW